MYLNIPVCISEYSITAAKFKTKEQSTMLGEYLTASELAQSLKVSRSCVYSLIRRGILPAGLKLGHVRRWPLNVVQQALNGEMNGALERSASA